MNAKQLRQAADEVRQQYHWDTETINPDLVIDLADHILSTVREDDDEAFSFDWCRTVSLGPSWDGVFVEIGEGFRVNFLNRVPEIETVRNIPVAKITTRAAWIVGDTVTESDEV